MKKILLFTAILFASITMVTGQTSSDVAILKVRLHAIQSIVVNPDQKVNVLNYNSISDYKDGVSVEKVDHLTVFSTGGFVVRVRTSEGSITSGDKSISSSTLKVIASSGVNNPLTSNYGSISLKDTDGDKLISNDAGAANNTFNITYAGLGDYGFINSIVKAGNPTVYRTTVTYTIAPR